MKSDKFYNSTASCLAGILLIIIGLCMIIGQDQLYFDFIKLFMLVVLILGFIQCIRYFFESKKDSSKKINFTRSVVYYLFCIVISCFPKIPMSILPLLFAIYLLLNGAIRIVSYYVLLKSDYYGRIKEFILFLIYVILGAQLLFFPLKNIKVMLYIIGSYVLLLGAEMIFDFISNIIPIRIKRSLRRKIRITIPILVQMLLPYAILSEINYYINKEEYEENFVRQRKDNIDDYDVEVFVHTSPRWYNRFGHVDMCIGDKVYSYGTYDDSSKVFFNSIGDGVLFNCTKEKYIKFCITHSQKTLIGFGLKLTDKQKQNIENYYEKLMKDTYEWNPPIVTEKDSDKEHDDYASCLYKSTNADFYKFKTGKFKKYFLLGTNCCLLADNVLGKAGTDILKVTGIITPGTYYDYLNLEFNKKNSIVVAKNIYNAESVGIKKSKLYTFFHKKSQK